LAAELNAAKARLALLAQEVAKAKADNVAEVSERREPQRA